MEEVPVTINAGLHIDVRMHIGDLAAAHNGDLKHVLFHFGSFQSSA